MQIWKSGIWKHRVCKSGNLESGISGIQIPDFQICTTYVSRFQISGNLVSGNLESGNIGRANLEIWNLETSVLEIWNLQRHGLFSSPPAEALSRRGFIKGSSDKEHTMSAQLATIKCDSRLIALLQYTKPWKLSSWVVAS